mmetsp:Transcript_62166/g.110818  ORF Transcript_62166/g.110818 Transcript_62166/m.110818 type:complete len:111 (+) Transcript_62166:499-831(+)
MLGLRGPHHPSPLSGVGYTATCGDSLPAPARAWGLVVPGDRTPPPAPGRGYAFGNALWLLHELQRVARCRSKGNTHNAYLPPCGVSLMLESFHSPLATHTHARTQYTHQG